MQARVILKLCAVTTFSHAPLSDARLNSIIRSIALVDHFNDRGTADQERPKHPTRDADGDGGHFEDASARSGLDKKDRLVLRLPIIFARGVFADVV